MPRPTLNPNLAWLQLLSVKRCIENAVADPDLLAELVAQALDTAMNDFERETRVGLWPAVVKCGPPTADLGEYDIREDYHDFVTSNYLRLGYFRMRRRPLVSVERVAVTYGPDRTLITYPSQWIRPDYKMGKVSVVPLIGSTAFTPLGGDYWLPLLEGGYLRNVANQFVAIDYTAGLQDVATDPEHAAVRTALGQRAAVAILDAVPQAIVSSSSQDGVSVSVASYEATRRTLWEAWGAFVSDYRDKNTGVVMTVL